MGLLHRFHCRPPDDRTRRRRGSRRPDHRQGVREREGDHRRRALLRSRSEGHRVLLQGTRLATRPGRSHRSGVRYLSGRPHRLCLRGQSERGTIRRLDRRTRRGCEQRLGHDLGSEDRPRQLRLEYRGPHPHLQLGIQEGSHQLGLQRAATRRAPAGDQPLVGNQHRLLDRANQPQRFAHRSAELRSRARVQRPFGRGGTRRTARANEDTKSDADISLDMSQRLGPNLSRP